MLQHAVAAFLSAVVLAPFSFYAGKAANVLKLPRITGYLVSGVICGPYVLGILSTTALSDLNLIEGACLSLIGLAAGAELHFADLQSIKRQVLLVTLAVSVFTWVSVYGVFLCLGLHQSLVPATGSQHIVAVASLAATLMIARSPASAIAVLKEMEGKGPFSTLVMAVVVVKDVLVIIGFALNIEFARLFLLPSGHPNVSAAMLVLPVVTVLVSMGLGVVGALLLGALLRPGAVLVPTVAQTPAAFARVRIGLLVLGSTVIFQVTHGLGADGLLACLTTGMILANRRHERADRDREELHNALALILNYSNVAFFGLAGASLKLSAISGTLGAALAVFVARMAGIWGGSWCGCRLGGTSIETRRTFWMSMVTQAGVAMGLARLAATRFPDWGPQFQTLMMSVIILNMFVGPPLFRMALLHAGEAKAHRGPGEHYKDVEDQSASRETSP